MVLAACSSSTAPPPGDGTVLVIGVQAESLGPDAKSAHVVASIGGRTVADQTIAAAQGSTLAFAPTEVRVPAPVGQPNARVDVRVDVLAGEGTAALRAPVLLTRLANAPFVQGQVKLLRLRLEQRCISAAVSPGGIAFGPTCVAPQTCISGRCVDATVAAQDLEPYAQAWPTDAPDICRPAAAGAPEVIVGSGQTDYLPMAEGSTQKLERGPQGGHHLWIAARMKNLHQSGSTTTITGVQPGTNVTILPTAFVFTFDKDEGGYCKLSGLRFQVDNGGVDYTQFLGKPLDVTLEIKDSSGLTAKATKRVNVDTKLVGE